MLECDWVNRLILRERLYLRTCGSRFTPKQTPETIKVRILLWTIHPYLCFTIFDIRIFKTTRLLTEDLFLISVINILFNENRDCIIVAVDLNTVCALQKMTLELNMYFSCALVVITLFNVLFFCTEIMWQLFIPMCHTTHDLNKCYYLNNNT